MWTTRGWVQPAFPAHHSFGEKKRFSDADRTLRVKVSRFDWPINITRFRTLDGRNSTLRLCSTRHLWLCKTSFRLRRPAETDEHTVNDAAQLTGASNLPDNCLKATPKHHDLILNIFSIIRRHLLSRNDATNKIADGIRLVLLGRPVPFGGWGGAAFERCVFTRRPKPPPRKTEEEIRYSTQPTGRCDKHRNYRPLAAF